jgi:hypothetical protein
MTTPPRKMDPLRYARPIPLLSFAVECVGPGDYRVMKVTQWKRPSGHVAKVKRTLYRNVRTPTEARRIADELNNKERTRPRRRKADVARGQTAPFMLEAAE